MKTELIILRDRIKECRELTSGLCLESSYLNLPDGGYALRVYIWEHRPKRGKHFRSDCRHSVYFWPAGQIKPRLDWLNHQIKYYWILKILMFNHNE